MKYIFILKLLLLFVGCNLIPNEDPDIHRTMAAFQNAVANRDDSVAWHTLSSDAQAKLDEATFRTLVSTGAEYEDLIQLFRTANITTRNRPRDIKTEHYILMTNLSGSKVAVRFVLTQEPDGTWRMANLLSE